MNTYYNDQTIIYLDGEYVKACEAKTDLYAQTLHYGSGVFEGIRSYNTDNGVKIFKPKEHYDRLLDSAKKMHIALNLTVEEFTEITYKVLEMNNLTDAYIRPLVYLGANMSLIPTAEVHVMVCAWDWGKYLGSKLLNLYVSSYQRPNPKSCHVEAKVTGHYINSILATTEAKAKGYDEALLLDPAGFVAEGPGANFFMQKDNKLFTAPLGNILPGITRATVIQLAKDNGIEVVEKLFTIEDVNSADSAFYTGTAAEVVGINSLNEYKFPLAWEKSFGFVLAQKYADLVLEK